MLFSRKRHRESDEPPTFRLVALGPSGCGKSVLLSSLFHELNFPTPGRAYHLEAELGQLTALSTLYDQLSDTTLPWPRPTGRNATREFVFDCMATDDAGVRHPILRMSWLDFSGELLEADDAQVGDAQRELQGRIENAHALMGILDGRAVRQLLNGTSEGQRYFASTLRPMFSVMQRSECPIHLVLTKWDLVRDFGEPAGISEAARLARVTEALMSFRHIKSLVDTRTGRQIVRIIPVSAVGPNFAQLDASGRVVKREDGELRPHRVEVPFCVVLPDLFEQVRKTLEDAHRDDLDAQARRRLRRESAALLASIGLVLRRPMRTALRLALAPAVGPLGGELSQLFFTWASAPLELNGRRILQEQTTREERSARLASLRRDVLTDFADAVRRMEDTFPNTQLNPAWARS